MIQRVCGRQRNKPRQAIRACDHCPTCSFNRISSELNIPKLGFGVRSLFVDPDAYFTRSVSFLNRSVFNLCVFMADKQRQINRQSNCKSRKNMADRETGRGGRGKERSVIILIGDF